MAANPKKTERPNFLFVFTDDQTYESIHALNNSEVHTPNLDKLSKQGVVFTHCFNQGSWSGAVCVASRTMLITGQTLYHAPRNGKHLVSWAKTKLTDDNVGCKLWPEVFTEAGYNTFLTGKWHNSDYAALKGFKYAKSIGWGMYETFDKNGSKDFAYGRPTATHNIWSPTDKSLKGHWSPIVKDIIYNESGEKKIGATYTVQQHTSELYTDNAISFLQTTAKDSDDPFFMYVAYNAPHDPRQAPKKYVDMYPPEKIAPLENFLPEHPFDQGDHLVRDEKLAPFPRTVDQVNVHRSEYYAIISHFDYELGRLMQALEKSGKADNTYIIFSADHGLAVGQHGLMGKQNQYDHSVRMPLIIAGPGLKGGRHVDAMVYLQSMFATTCDLAGLETPESVDFPSLNGLLEGKEDKVYDAIYGGYLNYQRMVRTDQYKLIYYPHVKKTQLFDIKADPKEMNNLADEKKYKKIKKQLFEKLQQMQKDLDDPFELSLN
ncbi:DUF4976 domain-containing protein [Puteibacter caeruleilacunae]|nr:DUF4976 domain-containing protein [Puteibacter caeruleilacunae]